MCIFEKLSFERLRKGFVFRPFILECSVFCIRNHDLLSSTPLGSCVLFCDGFRIRNSMCYQFVVVEVQQLFTGIFPPVIFTFVTSIDVLISIVRLQYRKNAFNIVHVVYIVARLRRENRKTVTGKRICEVFLGEEGDKNGDVAETPSKKVIELSTKTKTQNKEKSDFGN